MERILVVLFFGATAILAQKMVTVTAMPGTLIPVHTALGHLTVIELPVPIEQVAAESSAFQVEWRDKTVFVYARQAGSATNLFVWTKQGRAIYELLAPAADVSQMDVSIETRMPDPPAAPAPRPAEHIPAGMLLHAEPVALAGSHKTPKHEACLLVRDVYRQKDHLYLRYEVENHSSELLSFDPPRLAAVRAATLPASLPAGKVVQIGLHQTVAFDQQGGDVLPVLVEEDLRSLGAGQSGLGIIGVKLPAGSSSSSVLLVRLWLPIREGAPLLATVVVR